MPGRLPPAVSMPKRLLDNLARHARAEEPRESCALLVGRPVAEGAAVAVTAALPATNAADAPETEFTIPSDELISVYKTVEESGLAVVGIFHSHPASGAVPSETDRRMMRINPVVWVIYSIRDGEARAYAADWEGGRAAEVRMDVG